jgi:hypothetical protein
MKRPRVIFLTGALLLASGASLTAYVSRVWSYEELIAKAELVVIAKAVTATTDTTEQIDHPDGVGILTADNKRIGLPVVGVETKFEVLAVFKGEKVVKEVVLHHYRERDKPEGVRFAGASFVTFSTEKKQPYLLFLIREADGRYGPASGHAGGSFDSAQPIRSGTFRR